MTLAATAPEVRTSPDTFRARLVALLDEYDTSPRGTGDALLAAYMRAALSARDALAMRVAREARRQGGGPQPQPQTRPGASPYVSMAPLYAGDPRPEVTRLLATRLRHRTARGAAS